MDKLAVKTAFTWRHGLHLTTEVQAGAPVERVDAGTSHERFYVRPSYFTAGSIARHDATYYGCCVEASNVIAKAELEV